MTDRKDFKRVVRQRARRTGESYSSALRNVRNARTPRAERDVAITRTIPEVRSTNVDKTVRFYTGLLGFDTRTEGDRVVSFVSASHDGVEVRLDGDGFALPPGFTVEVATAADVAELAARAQAAEVRVVEPLHQPDGEAARCSLLDPSGRRVTIQAAAPGGPPSAANDADRPIARAIPGSVLDPQRAKGFYVDVLGFRVRREWPGMLMLESPTTRGAEILTDTTLTSPDGFDLDVGTVARVDAIHAAAVGKAVVLGEPADFPEQGIRCFPLIDPNGVAINVAARRS